MIGPSCCSQNVLYNAANRLDEVIVRLAEDRLHALENAMDLISQILDVARRNEDVFRLLLDRGGENEADACGRTAPYQASAARHLEIIKLSLDRGVGIDSVDREGNTALVAAAADGHVDAVKFELNRGSYY